MNTTTQSGITPTQVEEESDLPEGWSVGALREIVSTLVDGSHNPPAKRDVGRPMLSARNIENNRLVMDEFRFISPADFKVEDARTSVRPGDVLLTIVGSIGRSLVVARDSEPFALQRSVAVMRPSFMNAKFIAYQFQAITAQKFFEENAAGTAQKGVYLGTLGRMPIFVAPAEEQDRIVTKIEDLFKQLNASRDRLAKVPKILKYFRQSVLAAACSGRLTKDWRAKNQKVEPAKDFLREIQREVLGNRARSRNIEQHLDFEPHDLPSTWQWSSVSNVCTSITDGDHQPPPKAQAGIPFVVISNISNRRLDLSDTMFVPTDYYEALSDIRKPRKNDLLYSVTGSYGIPILIKDDMQFCFQRHIALLRPHPKFRAEYLYRVMESDLIFRQATQVATGIAQLTVPLSGLRFLRIPVPPLAEQHEIVRRVEALFKLADTIEKRVDAATKRADKLTKAILAKAFRGELVPTEAEFAREEGRDYEPASVLLERIKSERQQSSAVRNNDKRPRRKVAKKR